ncbi:hypothetical protein SASPL_140691 [Salvia splendens]|uniref:Ribose-phosphate pyrophosphokinase n=1 Tax=Salvia splendens TaxID=180675 RepID=A0A8X8WRG4_SALSN|nr:hypothetical protein SASPL_140691 [Salvia splendens]
MASLLLPPPTSSSAVSSLFSRSSFPTPTARFTPARCELTGPVNGKPYVPVLNDQILPKYLQSRRLETALNTNTTNNRIKIFSGTGNFALSQEIASYMGLNLGNIHIKRFADGEIYVQLQESVRGCDVYLVQPTCPPANENLMELLIMIDACRRASAKNITAVIPYFGYARADRKTQGRESIAAKLVANLITEAGADRVLACDIHSGQSMGYFDIPVDHVYCQISSGDLVVVSPDVGGVARARAFAKKLSDAPLAIVDKRRQGHNVAEVMNLIGDVKGKVAVMVDDMIDTAGTIAKGAELLHEVGAREVYACSTHAVFRYDSTSNHISIDVALLQRPCNREVVEWSVPRVIKHLVYLLIDGDETFPLKKDIIPVHLPLLVPAMPSSASPNPRKTFVEVEAIMPVFEMIFSRISGATIAGLSQLRGVALRLNDMIFESVSLLNMLRTLI